MSFTTYDGRGFDPDDEEDEEEEDVEEVAPPINGQQAPVRVLTAFNFAAFTHNTTGWHQFATNDETGSFSKFRKRKMSVNHRHAYNRALLCLARYFDGQDVDREPVKYEPN